GGLKQKMDPPARTSWWLSSRIARCAAFQTRQVARAGYNRAVIARRCSELQLERRRTRVLDARPVISRIVAREPPVSTPASNLPARCRPEFGTIVEGSPLRLLGSDVAWRS